MRAKSIPKRSSKQNYVLGPFWIDVGWILAAFSNRKPSPNQPKSNQNSDLTRRQPKNKKVYFVLAGPVESCCRPCGVLSKNSEKSTQQPSKSSSQIIAPGYIDLGSNWAPFWEGLGLQVGAKLAPSCLKSRSNIPSKK